MRPAHLGMLALFAGEFLREIVASYGLVNFGERFDYLEFGVVALMCLSGPVLGTLSDVFGRTQVLKWSLLGLTITSLGFYALDIEKYFGAPLNIDCLLLGVFFGVRSVAFAAILDGTDRAHCSRAVIQAMFITAGVWVVFALASMSVPSLLSKSHYLLALGIGSVGFGALLEWSAPLSPHSSHLQHALSTPPGPILLWKRRDLGIIVMVLLLCQIGWWTADVYLFASGSPGVMLADSLLYQAGLLSFAVLLYWKRSASQQPPSPQILRRFVSVGIRVCVGCCMLFLAFPLHSWMHRDYAKGMVALLSFGSGLYVPALWIFCLSRARWTWHGRICGILDGTMLLAETLAVWTTTRIAPPDQADFYWLLFWFGCGFACWWRFQDKLLEA
jgi:hypothetical protein